MSNKMSFKIKSSSNKRKTSSPNSNPSTATNSQSSVGVTSNKHETSIDDPLVNDEIKLLRVTEEHLKELHPANEDPLEPEIKETRVFVKELPPTPSPRPENTKHVVVLHPMPLEIRPAKTKLLGSLKSGPRCDQDNVFISHSIIGTFEEYTESRLADRNSLTGTVPSTVPPVVLPKVSKKKNKSTPAIPKETNALSNWEKQINRRKVIQERISKRLKGEKGDLTMNYGDTFRRVQEERSFIDRAIPAIDSGKGHFVGSEFWRLQSTVGDPVTGIRTTLTKTEKGDPPVTGFISCPSSATNRNNMFQTWSRSRYLWKRKEQLSRAVSEPKYPVDFDSLQLRGLVQPSVLPPPPPLGSSHSLDSLGESLFNEEDEDDEERERGEDGRTSACNSLEESVSLLDTHPDVAASPFIGPALQIQDQLYAWFGDGGRGEGEREMRRDDYKIRILFEAGIQQLAMNHIVLQNRGTVAISFTWKKFPGTSKLGLKTSEQTQQRFYFDTREGVILPGRNLSLDFIFKSPNPGIFSETWEIVTRPVLLSNNGQSPLYVTLKGVSFQPDLYQEKRDMIERKLYHDVAKATSKRLVDQLVNTIHTPPRSVTPLPVNIPEESEFLSKNPGVYYHYNAVQQLKALYIDLHNPTPPQEPTKSGGGGAVGGGTVGGKKQQEPKKGGGAGGKKINKEESHKQLHVDTNPDHSVDLNFPPWDLSLNTLEKLILEIDDGNVREDKYKTLNAIISEISAPLPSAPRSTRYIKTYFLLCEAIDTLVSTSEHLRQVMGLPSKDSPSAGGLQEEESQSELDQSSQPSSPVIIPPQSSKKDQSKRGSKVKEVSVKEKEKEQLQQRPTSKKGGPKSNKKGGSSNMKGNSKISKIPSVETQDTSNSNAIPSKPSEIDPMLTLKYKEIFLSVAHDIMASTVDQVSSLISEDI
ncbi:PREDICTED: MYCBP-associated protein-like isoform X2 [Amphimedon queenslandica]|uniref:MYCBP-associated protein n=1 Tax=Amphimedon queenslandica TaxID=400682 RepID=A0AAN0IZ35_AMPQE|nr:PREDICTED: MYCBP-associated protein-like isoform X2 [Amphimedon queenslandica]|eukprot:XP_019849716.1 PREDICTED: MYCBP-associated protein-like isoform X2 [Amphimedon queenslandica]